MVNYIWGDKETQFFYYLLPDVILDSIESLGLRTTGRCLTLNSMENRVYEIEVEDPVNPDDTSPTKNFIIAKFYRPGRWTKEQILDEHQFLLDLVEDEVPVIAPYELQGNTLHKLKDHDLWYALFPKKGGRAPSEMNVDQLEIMGRMLARLHNVGSRSVATHRLQINPNTFGTQNLKFLLDNHFIPNHFRSAYQQVVEEIIKLSTPWFKSLNMHRIHGDCHLGNIIWRDSEGPYFIDFDDMLMGPAIQDIWLVVPGTDLEGRQDREILLEAYESMRPFDRSGLKLIEPLRALRYIHFSAWIAKRYEDPSFKIAFPQFGSEAYWEAQINDLRFQLSIISDSSSAEI